jgi:4-aminobutyrate aminotransferase-like enzyme
VVLTSAINPGLGIRKLHEYGITGKGISVAVIDKPILSTHRAYESGRYFLSEMQKIRDKSILIKDVRGKGLMLGVELSDRRQNNRNLSEKIYQEMLCRKFIIGLTPKSNMLRFFPPLIMSEKHISNMCSALEEIFSKVEQRKL